VPKQTQGHAPRKAQRRHSLRKIRTPNDCVTVSPEERAFDDLQQSQMAQPEGGKRLSANHHPAREPH
jgi:hypothetical protein